jgi:hypothetical protein
MTCDGPWPSAVFARFEVGALFARDFLTGSVSVADTLSINSRSQSISM